MIQLILRCLEEAMKRNGDARLSSVREEDKEVLERTGVSRLFEVFDTEADALQSFHQLPPNAALNGTPPVPSSHRVVSAA
jgi:anti-anti-sigma regulatory factor